MRISAIRTSVLCLDGLLSIIIGWPLRVIRRCVVAEPHRKPRNILIIELWGIGDLAMMSSIVKPLRERFPESKLHLVAQPHAEHLFSGTGAFDRIEVISFPWTRFSGKYRFWAWPWRAIHRTVDRCRKVRYDLILDARGDLRNNVLSFILRGRRRIGLASSAGSYWLTDRVSVPGGTIHRMDAWKSSWIRVL